MLYSSRAESTHRKYLAFSIPYHPIMTHTFLLLFISVNTAVEWLVEIRDSKFPYKIHSQCPTSITWLFCTNVFTAHENTRRWSLLKSTVFIGRDFVSGFSYLHPFIFLLYYNVFILDNCVHYRQDSIEWHGQVNNACMLNLLIWVEIS